MTVFLPNATWAEKQLPVTPRETINASATPASETQLTVAADNAPLRVIYGQCRLGPQIACVVSYQGALVILAVWGQGEVDAIVSLQIDDRDTPAGVTATHYTGSMAQTADPILVAAFAAHTPPVAYADALAGICYSVVRVPAGTSSGFPRLNAIIKGKKVWTGTASTWSDNPAWCLADFITDPNYGMGRTVDWESVASVAADCDALVGVAPNQEKLRTLNLVLENIQPVANWLDTLRTYAGCWVVSSGGDLKLISDKAGTPTADFDHADATILAIGAIKKRGVQNTPTVMTVTYTDTSVTPYRDATAVAYAAGVLEGSTPRRESQVSLPGIQRYSQAFREATERLNKLLLNDLSLELSVFDEGLQIEVGDIVTVTHPLGLDHKQLRALGVQGEYGRYRLALTEYDPAVYAAGVASGPTWTDTNLPSPTAPPAVTGLNLLEEIYQQQDGTWSSRIRATWNPATYGFLKYYRAEVWSLAKLIYSVPVESAGFASPPMQEGQTYTVQVQAVSTIGAAGSWVSDTITAQGKQLAPGNVTNLSGFEVGGEVRLAWSAAIDIDIWRYAIRYGAVGVAWEAATPLDQVDALRFVTKDIPQGTWDFLVKAIDSVGNVSPVAAVRTITVTLDVASFLVDNHTFTTPTLTAMNEYALGRTDGVRRFISSDATAFGTRYPAALATYGSLLQTAAASEWLSETYDFGLTLSGNWTASASASAATGAITQTLELSTNGTTWTAYVAMVAKTTARFARVRLSAAIGNALAVTLPAVSIRVDAIPREENGQATSLAAGGKTITLANAYAAVQSLVITPLGTLARTATADAITVGATTSFTVYVFNEAGVQVAAAFRWTFKGV